MSEASPVSTGAHIATAFAAGKLVSTKDSTATAVKDRHEALARAIADKSDKIDVAPVTEEPESAEKRAALAKDLDEYGAAQDKKVLTVAKEVLSLVTLDESTREAAGDQLDDVKKALEALSEIDIDGLASPTPRASTGRASSKVVPDEPSKTELERMALPIHKRTERFWFKLGLLVAGVVVAGIAIFVMTRTPPNVLLAPCQEGDKAKCWQMVVDEDTESQGQHVTPEPLERLCEEHKDACACGGLAYLNASSTEDSADCANLERATKIDPKWPCTCTRYGFWKLGEQKITHCGTPKCN